MRPSPPFAHALDAWLAAQCGAGTPEELPARLAARQRELLNAQLRHAVRHSRLYAARLAGRESVSSLAELADLPFTTAEDLRRWEDVLCVSRSAVERMVSVQTSGSTGQPKRLAFSLRDLGRTRDFFGVGMRFLADPGQTLCVLLPGAHRPQGIADLLRQGLVPQGIDVATDAGLADALLAAAKADEAALTPLRATVETALRAAAPARVLLLLPAQLRGLLRCCPTALPGVSGILSAADWLDPDLRTAARQAWGIPLLEHYGSTESAFAGAVECPACDGLHWQALDLLPEVVDPLSGEPLPPGQPGELVLTTLQREALPLIRYRTGDMVILEERPCACGSPLPRLRAVLGRIVRGPDGLRLAHPAKGGAGGAAREQNLFAEEEGPCVTRS